MKLAATLGLMAVLGAFAIGCGGSSSQGGSCKYQCLNRVRTLFESCTSTAACTLSTDATTGERDICYADGKKLSIVETTTVSGERIRIERFFSGGSLCLRRSTEAFAWSTGIGMADVFISTTDADSPEVAELMTVGNETSLFCDGINGQVIDTSDTSCFPSQNNGPPDFIDFAAMAACTVGTCAVP